jgi:GNAT superfamily N-acetyltransferase
MTFHARLLKKSDPDLNKVKALIHSVFPPQERAPFFFLKKRLILEEIECIGFYQTEEFIGFSYLINHHDLTFILYLAIDPKFQGDGYGSEALAWIKKYKNQKRLYLTIEPIDEEADNIEQRKRRKDFYLRNHFTEADFKVKDLVNYFEVMVMNGRINKADIRGVIRLFTGPFLYLFFRPKFMPKN